MCSRRLLDSTGGARPASSDTKASLTQPSPLTTNPHLTKALADCHLMVNSHWCNPAIAPALGLSWSGTTLQNSSARQCREPWAQLEQKRNLQKVVRLPSPVGPSELNHQLRKISRQPECGGSRVFWMANRIDAVWRLEMCLLPAALTPLTHTVNVQALVSAASVVSPGHPSYTGQVIMQSTGSFRPRAGGTACTDEPLARAALNGGLGEKRNRWNSTAHSSWLHSSNAATGRI